LHIRENNRQQASVEGNYFIDPYHSSSSLSLSQ